MVITIQMQCKHVLQRVCRLKQAHSNALPPKPDLAQCDQGALLRSSCCRLRWMVRAHGDGTSLLPRQDTT